MSKTMCDKELAAHCHDSICTLDRELTKLSTSPLDKMKKRAMLIAYWLKTYVRYFTQEDSFSSESVFRLKRGSIVRVEFGYRAGRELGGRHYAVVLDTNNAIHRNTVTVIPLGSVKDKQLDDKYCVTLKDGIYGPVKGKLDALLADGRQSIDDANKMKAELESATPARAQILRALMRARIDNANRVVEKAVEWTSEIDHMSQGSFALVDQITTISKMRISQPLEKTHPLYGVRLTPQDMDKIDEKIHLLFFSLK